MSTYGHADKKYLQSRVILSSAGRGWSGIAADLRAHPVCEVPPFNPVYTEVIIAIRGCSGLVLRTGGGERQETRSAAGKIWLSPAGISMDEICITGPHEETLHLYLPAEPFSSLADDEMFRIEPYSLRYLADIQDEMIRQIGLAILSEMASETAAGRMLVETSALALAARLAHSYAEPASVKPRGSRSHRLDEIRLRRVLDYIAQHPDEDITVAQLAGVACLSPFHFARMFKAAMGAAPHRYVSQQRLQNAMMLLAAGKRSLSDIALSCQFSSQANFNRAFPDNGRHAGRVPKGQAVVQKGSRGNLRRRGQNDSTRRKDARRMQDQYCNSKGLKWHPRPQPQERTSRGLPAPNSDFYQLVEVLKAEELAVIKMVRAFIGSKVAPVINKYWAEDAFPFELLPGLKELSIGGLGLPGYGCKGGSQKLFGMVAMELARVDPSFATFWGVHDGLAMGSIRIAVSEEQKQKWLPPMARMEKIGCFGLTEPTVRR